MKSAIDLIGAGLLLLLSAPAIAGLPSVTITGGLQPDGSYYRWEVVNHSASAVVSVEFPHYQADQFILPDDLRGRGWKSKCTYLVNVGVEDRPGTCRAEAPKNGGIPPQGKATFTMRVRLLESRQGRGIVKVKLADGTSLEIADVEVPCMPGYFERFGVLITLAILMGLAALIAVCRRHRKQLQSQPRPDTPEAPGSTPPFSQGGTP